MPKTYLNQQQIFRALKEKYKAEKTLKTDRITDMMAYRAAMLMMTNGLEVGSFSFDTDLLEKPFETFVEPTQPEQTDAEQDEQIILEAQAAEG